MSRLRLSFCRACGTRRSTSAMAASLQIPPSVSLKPFSCSGLLPVTVAAHRLSSSCRSPEWVLYSASSLLLTMYQSSTTEQAPQRFLQEKRRAPK